MCVPSGDEVELIEDTQLYFQQSIALSNFQYSFSTL